MELIRNTIAAELERPRELTAQVVKYLSGTYGVVDDDAIGPFLIDELPKLEDYEIDLILSPVFTPKLADQAVFAELLGMDSVSREQWPALIQQLATRPTCAMIITNIGQSSSVPLREVTLERYVHRLRLEGRISESLFKLLERRPASERPLLKAIARRAVWDDERRREILDRYVTRTTATDIFQAGDMLALLNVVEGYKPADLIDLLEKAPRWEEALRQQLNVASGPKPFFMSEVEQMHGGDRDQRHGEDVRMNAKQSELSFLVQLQQVLAD